MWSNIPPSALHQTLIRLAQISNTNSLPSLAATSEQPPKSNTPTTFYQFSNLPAELRSKIWQLSIPSRTVPLVYNAKTAAYHTSLSPPAILQVNHEARNEAVRNYTLSFGISPSIPRVHFNPSKDTLYLPRHGAMGYDESLRDFSGLVGLTQKGQKGENEGLGDNSLDTVRSIAVDHVDPTIKRPWEAYNKAIFLRGFRSLEEVVVVVPHLSHEQPKWNGDGAEFSQVELSEPRMKTKEDVERILRIWVNFRQGFLAEERGIEEVCRSMGKEYTRFELPTVRIRERKTRCADKWIINSNV